MGQHIDAGSENLNEAGRGWVNCLSFICPIRQSKLTRICYVAIIFLVISICTFMISPRLTGWLQQTFCSKFSNNCDLLIGYDAAYRVGFALAIWFLILTFATLGINSSSERRAKIQNNCWVLKIVGLLLIEFIFILIPHSEYNGEIWIFFGLNGAFCYIIIQYTFILDAANSFNSFLEFITREGSTHISSWAVTWFKTAKKFTIIFLYAVSLFSSITFYFLYAAPPECMDNFVFLLFHLIMCFSASVIAILPVVRDISPRSDLFPCSVTSLYCTYLIWLAFSSEPDKHCNPSDAHRYPGPPTQNVQILVSLLITFGTLIFISLRDLLAPQFGKVCFVAKSSDGLRMSEDLKQAQNGKGISEDGYGDDIKSSSSYVHERSSPVSSGQKNSNSKGHNPFASSPQVSQDNLNHPSFLDSTVQNANEEERKQNTSFVWDDEINGVEYSYSFFHLTFCLATIFLVMSVTNWYRLDEGEHLSVRLIRSWSAVWLRISASIFCSFILIWSMVVPILFPDSYHELLFFQYMTSLPKSSGRF